MAKTETISFDEAEKLYESDEDYVKNSLLNGVPYSQVLKEALQEIENGEFTTMTEEELREFNADPAAFERKRRTSR